MDRTTTTPERSADRADAGTAGSLLLPQLLASAGDEFAILRRSRSLAQRGAVVLYRLPQKRVVHLTGEHSIGKFKLADFRSTEIYYVDVCHRPSVLFLC